MPFITSSIAAVQQSAAKTSTVSMPFSAGTVVLPVTFATPMSTAVYTPTFSLGNGIAVPAITISNQSKNGYTATFVALSAGTVTATVIGS